MNVFSTLKKIFSAIVLSCIVTTSGFASQPTAPTQPASQDKSQHTCCCQNHGDVYHEIGRVGVVGSVLAATGYGLYRLYNFSKGTIAPLVHPYMVKAGSAIASGAKSAFSGIKSATSWTATKAASLPSSTGKWILGTAAAAGAVYLGYKLYKSWRDSRPTQTQQPQTAAPANSTSASTATSQPHPTTPSHPTASTPQSSSPTTPAAQPSTATPAATQQSQQPNEGWSTKSIIMTAAGALTVGGLSIYGLYTLFPSAISLLGRGLGSLVFNVASMAILQMGMPFLMAKLGMMPPMMPTGNPIDGNQQIPPELMAQLIAELQAKGLPQQS